MPQISTNEKDERSRTGRRSTSGRRIQAEFADRKRKLLWAVIYIGLMAAAVAILGFSSAVDPIVMAGMFVVVFIGAIIINTRLWRCPACNAHLGKLFIGIERPHFCPGCGVKLTE